MTTGDSHEITCGAFAAAKQESALSREEEKPEVQHNRCFALLAMPSLRRRLLLCNSYWSCPLGALRGNEGE